MNRDTMDTKWPTITLLTTDTFTQFNSMWCTRASSVLINNNQWLFSTPWEQLDGTWIRSIFSSCIFSSLTNIWLFHPCQKCSCFLLTMLLQVTMSWQQLVTSGSCQLVSQTIGWQTHTYSQVSSIQVKSHQQVQATLWASTQVSTRTWSSIITVKLT